MKFVKSIAALAAAVTLVAASASATVNGWATGRWNAVDSMTVMAHGTLLNLRDQAMYDLTLRLYGPRTGGNVTGLLATLPRPGTIEYRVLGTYGLSSGGYRLVNARIVMVVPKGGIYVVGNFSAVLQDNIVYGPVDPVPTNPPARLPVDPTPKGSTVPVGPGPVPMPRAHFGHLHGRWLLF